MPKRIDQRFIILRFDDFNELNVIRHPQSQGRVFLPLHVQKL
jgi:hypothetical protein